MEIIADTLKLTVRWITQEPLLAVLVAAGAYLLLLILVVWTLLRYHTMMRRQVLLLKGADGTSLERMLLAHVDGSTSLRSDVSAVVEASTKNAGAVQQCLQRIGIVRYDAYGDVGGFQSFSIALLDAGGSGVVLTGLHGRSDMRVYAKPVVAGTSSLVLTDEERQAIAESRVGGPVLTDNAAMPTGGGGVPRRRS